MKHMLLKLVYYKGNLILDFTSALITLIAYLQAILKLAKASNSAILHLALLIVEVF